MKLINIKLKNFKKYDNIEQEFDDIVFIIGKNGAGKSTLAWEALLFCVYGYSPKPLLDLPTRDKSKSCEVNSIIEHKGNIYDITRKYPSSIKILKNKKELKFETLKEAQDNLNSLFGDINYFKKFRMIDTGIGINFLEEGSQALKKILFSVSDEIFNKVKEKLNNIKREREIYNREKAVIYTNHPSEERLRILRNAINVKSGSVSKLKQEDNELQRDQYKYNNQKGQAEGQLKNLNWQKNQTIKSTHCYACKQELLPETKQRMLKEKETEIEKAIKLVTEAEGILKETEEIRNEFKSPIEKLLYKIENLKRLITRLEGRLKQKEYKYTSRDIEIVKQALKELDNLSTKYLIQSIRILEPIINSVLTKINFEVSFDINEKGKFSIDLFKEGIKYKYKDLSTGEKLLLQIAFKLALLLDRAEDGIVIADEGLSSLDEENILHILTIFKQFPLQLVAIIHHFVVPENIKTIDLGEKEY